MGHFCVSLVKYFNKMHICCTIQIEEKEYIILFANKLIINALHSK